MSSGVLKGSPLGQLDHGAMKTHASKTAFGSFRSVTVTLASTSPRTPTSQPRCARQWQRSRRI
jgi:hypothetical protein